MFFPGSLQQDGGDPAGCFGEVLGLVRLEGPALGGQGLAALEGWELFDFPAGFLFGKAQLVEPLQIQPELRAGAEEVGQA